MKRLFVIFLMVTMVLGMKINAQNVRSVFIEMPDSLILLLTQNDRRDCIDFMEAGMRAVVTNRLGGKSELKKLTDDFLSVNMSESSVMQIKLLPYADRDTVICVVNTVCVEACNSVISFYNRSWEKMDKMELFNNPEISDFFVSSDSVQRYIDMADIYLVKLDLQSETDSLRAEYTMPGYMTKDDSVRIAPMLQPLWYKWNGKRFIR